MPLNCPHHPPLIFRSIAGFLSWIPASTWTHHVLPANHLLPSSPPTRKAESHSEILRPCLWLITKVNWCNCLCISQTHLSLHLYCLWYSLDPHYFLPQLPQEPPNWSSYLVLACLTSNLHIQPVWKPPETADLICPSPTESQLVFPIALWIEFRLAWHTRLYLYNLTSAHLSKIISCPFPCIFWPQPYQTTLVLQWVISSFLLLWLCTAASSTWSVLPSLLPYKLFTHCWGSFPNSQILSASPKFS